MAGTYTEVRSVLATVQSKYDTLCGAMNEQFRRRWAGCEALAIGRGGVSAVAAATGMSRNTVLRGISEIREHLPELAERMGEGRVRRPGGGRLSRTAEDASLLSDLQSLLESTTRGEPETPLLWTSKSTRKLAEELTARGHVVSHMTVDRLLGKLGYSLQANRKTREGQQHPDRDGQFEHLNTAVRRFGRRGQPVVSVDTKKRELVGDFRNPGQEWHPQGQPEEVRTHDFRDKMLGVAIPYGVYDPTRKEGWVSVGIDHDTAEFAVQSIRRWWRQMGCLAYPRARELLITADGGGSNGSRGHLWKWCLQQLADETQLAISVCHFPPGTSKWNKIEHQMFCHIAQNWRGHPLVSQAVIVNLIGHTTTRQGLRVNASLDTARYERKIKISKEQLESLRLSRDAYHGDWNYKLTPRQQS
jgi:transposase